MLLDSLLSRVLAEAESATGRDLEMCVDMVSSIAEAERSFAVASRLFGGDGDVSVSLGDERGSLSDEGVGDAIVDGVHANESVHDDVDIVDDGGLGDDGTPFDDDEGFDSQAEPLSPNGTVDDSLLEGKGSVSSVTMTQLSGDDAATDEFDGTVAEPSE